MIGSLIKDAARAVRSRLFSFVSWSYDAMVVTRKRKRSNSDDDVPQSAPKKACPDKSESESSFSLENCLQWFRQYSGETADLIGPEEIEKLCEDIDVKPENVVMLVLAYKLKALRMGYFTLTEWQTGMAELQCDSAEKLKKNLDLLRLLSNPKHEEFKDVFQYAFNFCLEEGETHLDKETSVAMLQLLFSDEWQLLDQFENFLLKVWKPKTIRKDEWKGILEFYKGVDPDLSNYDNDAAWPVIFDDFVAWHSNQSQKSSSEMVD